MSFHRKYILEACPDAEYCLRRLIAHSDKNRSPAALGCSIKMDIPCSTPLKNSFCLATSVWSACSIRTKPKCFIVCTACSSFQFYRFAHSWSSDSLGPLLQKAFETGRQCNGIQVDKHNPEESPSFTYITRQAQSNYRRCDISMSCFRL